MTRRISRLWCLPVLLSATATATATATAATIVYSNLGPGDTYNGSSGLTIDSTHTPAQSFIPSASVALDAIQVAVLRNPYFYAYTGDFNATLAADNSGVPGAAIASLGTGATSADLGSGINTDHLVSLTPVGPHPTLTAGTRYWLILSHASANSAAGWMFNSLTPPDTSPNRSSFNGGPFNPTGTIAVALRVSGSSLVPLPASALAATPLLGLLAATRLRHRRPARA